MSGNPTFTESDLLYLIFFVIYLDKKKPAQGGRRAKRMPIMTYEETSLLQAGKNNYIYFLTNGYR
jgi:hypothetical protein